MRIETKGIYLHVRLKLICYNWTNSNVNSIAKCWYDIGKTQSSAAPIDNHVADVILCVYILFYIFYILVNNFGVLPAATS